MSQKKMGELKWHRVMVADWVHTDKHPQRSVCHELVNFCQNFFEQLTWIENPEQICKVGSECINLWLFEIIGEKGFLKLTSCSWQKELTDMYCGPDRVAAKQQNQELERVAKTLPEDIPSYVKRFTDQTLQPLQVVFLIMSLCFNPDVPIKSMFQQNMHS